METDRIIIAPDFELETRLHEIETRQMELPEVSTRRAELGKEANHILFELSQRAKEEII